MKNRKSGGFLDKLSAFIVDKRTILFVLYIFLFVFCIFSMGWVNVESDVTKYLPEDSETRQGFLAMNESFAFFGTGQAMVSNITFEDAQALADELSAVEGLAMVTFDNSPEHYTDACALYDLTFAGANFDEVSLEALAEVERILADYDSGIYTMVGFDENGMLQDEMAGILIAGIFAISVVLILTSRSYAEIPVLAITFGAAALMNMGTNYLLGTISFISDSIAVVLQLALAIDYAIILCHRFSDEFDACANARDAAVEALRKSIPEVGASSLTTVSGLAALGFMKFGIGLDMAMVMIKAIFMSLFSVFTLMPGLLVLFSPLIRKTRHKKLLPDINFAGRFAVKTRRVVPLLFILVLVGAFYLSGKCPYAYSYYDLKTAKMTDRQHTYFKIKDTFGTSNMVALLVPSGDYAAEEQLLAELEQRSEVKSTMGLAGIEAMDGYMLTQALGPRELAELMDMDYELIQLLYTAYAAENSEAGQLISGIEDYKVPLFDMFLFLKDQLDANKVDLGGGDMDIGSMLDQLEMARTQMRSEKFSRLVVYLNLPDESEETFAFLDELRTIIGKYYGDQEYYVVGTSTSSRDLAASFEGDNLIIAILSTFFVILVLLFTFRSAGLSVLLIIVIQGSIWLNFSFPYLLNEPLYFLGYLIVQAVQMGANIDYAIVISNHYQEEKAHMHHKKAIIAALNSAFPTVFTSGTIMAATGLLIGYRSAQPVVAIMGACLGRGTIISMILVLFVLPAFLVLGDSIIERTRFRLKGLEPRVRTASGTVRVRGHVRGYISGVVDAEIDGILHGQFNASIATGGELHEEEDKEDA